MRLISILRAMVCVVVAMAAAARGEQGGGRPNILFIISDDQSWCHTGIGGDPVVKTPTFDRVAREGVLFTQAHCMSPSCTPSRGSILTGRPIWQLEEGANLWAAEFKPKFACYPDLLAGAGYAAGYTGKGWSPGVLIPPGRDHNPAGPAFKSFEAFLASVPKGQPFCFWFGSHFPHRPYVKGSGVRSGMKLADVRVPPCMPDAPEVRGDIADYLYAIQQFDAQAAELLALLEKRGEMDNTIVVMTSDNGMPFPRCKSNLYEYSTHMPLAVRWGAKVKGGRRIEDYISFIDYAPTFLEAAGVKAPGEMVGRSFLDLLTGEKSGKVDPQRKDVLLALERHANVREGTVGYPRRAIRTAEFLYIRNFEPTRWPAGDPPKFGDCDPSSGLGQSGTKDIILTHRDEAAFKAFFAMAFDKRPGEELYDLKKDPEELKNVAGEAEYAPAKQGLREELERRLRATGDPRMGDGAAPFDSYRYHGAKRAGK